MSASLSTYIMDIPPLQAGTSRFSPPGSLIPVEPRLPWQEKHPSCRARATPRRTGLEARRPQYAWMIRGLASRPAVKSATATKRIRAKRRLDRNDSFPSASGRPPLARGTPSLERIAPACQREELAFNRDKCKVNRLIGRWPGAWRGHGRKLHLSLEREGSMRQRAG